MSPVLRYFFAKAPRAWRQHHVSLPLIFASSQNDDLVLRLMVPIPRSFITILTQQGDFLPSYLSHGVVLHCYFPEEEVDIVSIVHCLDEIWFCEQIGNFNWGQVTQLKEF